MKKKKKEMEGYWQEVDERLIGMGRNIGCILSDVINVDEEKLEKELEEDKKFHKGRPKKMPDSVVRIGIIFHSTLNIKWRQLEGFLKEIIGEKYVAKYSQIRERAEEMKKDDDLKIVKLSGKRGIVGIFRGLLLPTDYFIDSTGLSLKNRGLWRVKKFKNPMNEKWVKLHILMNKKGEICAFALTDSTVHDSLVYRIIARYLPKGSRVYGDKAYFSRKNYKISEERGIELHSPPKKNARTLAKGVRSYRNEVLMYKKLGYNKWAEVTGYKRRFNKEYIFSRFKTLFGEALRERTLSMIFLKVLSCIILLNISLNLS